MRELACAHMTSDVPLLMDGPTGFEFRVLDVDSDAVKGEWYLGATGEWIRCTLNLLPNSGPAYRGHILPTEAGEAWLRDRYGGDANGDAATTARHEAEARQIEDAFLDGRNAPDTRRWDAIMQLACADLSRPVHVQYEEESIEEWAIRMVLSADALRIAARGRPHQC